MVDGVVIEGMGKDAEVVVNEKGGKQSKAPMALHLVDPYFLSVMYSGNTKEVSDFINCVTSFMEKGFKGNLLDAIHMLGGSTTEIIIDIAKVLKEGAEKYEANNWRLIPQEDHLNHALSHYLAYLMADSQDDHLSHCRCRLMMAFCTEKSPGFSYNEYIPS